MTLEEIKTAVDNGQTVYWCNALYTVTKDRHDAYIIVCSSNGYTIGLTHRDGLTLNGEPNEFYISSH